MDSLALTPGLHLISNFISEEKMLLASFASFRTFMDDSIERHDLSKVGEAYHDFDGGGFTAVVCLAESHLSIHTWPEQGYVTFDIFLSNFHRDNSERGRAVYREVLTFFGGQVLFENSLRR